MLLKHSFTGKIAHSSYILAGKESCAVIDPRRDVDLYIDEARALGVTITHILETHLHADFISGHMDLARRTGATTHAPKSAQCAFDHVLVVPLGQCRPWFFFCWNGRASDLPCKAGVRVACHGMVTAQEVNWP